MSYLIVVAHPDDEVLGAGATIAKLARRGDEVNVCILSSQAKARYNRTDDRTLEKDTEESMHILGVKQVFPGDFPNIKMNTVPHLELVQFIESVIVQTGATTIITHHPSDLNNDHVQTSLACQAAARLFQRRPDVPPLKSLLYMEVPSSTEWALNSSIEGFRPDTYVEIGQDGLDIKLRALACYHNVMRPYPHPRSPEAITGLAAYRGAASGCCYAEAFECALWCVRL